MKRIYFFLMCIISVSGIMAQQTVSGKVTDDVGEALLGVNVVIKGTSNGTTTDIDGNYRLTASSDDMLVFSFVGFETQEVSVGTRSVIDVTMGGATELQEVIVTGVAQGTATSKLGFSIAKVDEELLGEVPALDPANALRGKVAGVQIVQSSGNPGNAASINLRGAKTISGSNAQPLIIVDGIITPPGSANLADINMNDVESIEVLKGAAGSSLYGSLAGNGVIQIITKRGSKEYGKTLVTVRNEFGTNDLLRKVPLSKHHNYSLDANGDYVLDVNGQRVVDSENIFDNPYPRLFDQQEEVFQGRNFSNNFVSIGSSAEKTNFYASFDNLVQEGLIEGQVPYERQSIRLNIDHALTDRFEVGLTGAYIKSEGNNPVEGDQDGFIYGTLLAEPDINLRDLNPDGQPFITRPREIGNFTNSNNPLYIAHNDIRIYDKNRLMLGAKGRYQIMDWWNVDAQISLDRNNYFETQQQDKNFLSQQGPEDGDGGFVDKRVQSDQARVVTISSNFNQTFGNFKGGLTLRYISEEYQTDFQQTAGSNLQSQGIFQLDNTDRTSLVSTSFSELFRAENYMVNATLDYRDKYIVDALFRIDRSSLFGSGARQQEFYRASFTYRISEDLSINGIDEWKFRASVGTSGQRPPFRAQYETFTLFGGNIVQGVLGNEDLKPSVVTEIELGTNIDFLDRFSLEVNYATSEIVDQILEVPLPGIAGFGSQFQNAGTVESKTIEVALNANIFKNDDWRVDAGFTYSRSRSKIVKLGRPDYILNAFNNTPLFSIAEGEFLGAIYGNVLATSVSELTVDEDGFVNNLVGAVGLTPADFEVNDDGYLIETGTQYTGDEAAFHLADASGARLTRKIGDTNPDALLGFNSSISYKNFNLFISMDAQIGGDIANVMRQNLLFNGRAAGNDQSGRPEGQRHWDAYVQSTTNSGNGLNQQFIESAQYTSLRELSISYTFGNSFFEKMNLGNVIRDAKLSLIGRNLFMWTDYSGFTPDISTTGGVASGSLDASPVDSDVLLNPTIFRADVYGYPMFRTYSATLQIRF